MVDPVNESRAQEPDGARADDVSAEIASQLRLLWRSRASIVVSVVVLGAIGGAVGLLRQRQYEASATIAVSAGRLGEQSPGLVPTEAWLPLLTTVAVQAKVVEAVKLPSVASVRSLASQVTVRTLPLTNLIRIVVRLDSPQDAATVANAYADHGVAAAAQLARIDVDTVQADLKTMLDRADEHLKQSEREYDTYRTGARFEMLDREVEALGAQRGELQDVVLNLESERARLSKLEAELKGRQPLTSLRQAVVDDPGVSQAVQARAPTGVLGLEMTREMPNPVFENLDEEAAVTRARVAYLDQRRLRLAATVGLNGSQLTSLTMLYERESRLARLQSERELARRSYEAIATKYQGAQLAAVGRTSQLLVVDRAVPLDAALSRYVALQTLLGGMVGGLLASIVVLGRRVFAGAPGL